MRIAIYARYSSDLQSPRSILDQLESCKAYAAVKGMVVVAAFSDAAISGATMAGRNGIDRLIEGVDENLFDGVLVESLDRLSRELADLAWLHRRFTRAGVKLFTLADGEVPMLMLAVKGGLSQQYLIDLAQKTKRGQVGRVKAGRIPGGRCYGYDVVRDGGEERGRRTMNQTEAAVVVRIFEEYAAGRSPLAIVAALNREGVPAPRGGQWNASTLNGSRKRANGILSNSLYRGIVTFGRQAFVKDPETGKRQAKPQPRSEWLTCEVSELAIVPMQLWDAVQARRAHVNAIPLARRPRAKRMLSGLLRCSECGGSYIVVSRDYLGCSTYRNKGTCTNARTIAMREVEDRVLCALQRHLLTPQMVAVAIEAYRVERQRLAKERARDHGNVTRELGEVKRKLDRMIRSIQDGVDAKGLAAIFNETHARKETLEAKLRTAPADDIAVLHPNAAERYRRKVADIHAALARGDAASREAIGLVRDLVQEIIVRPEPDRVALEVVGDLAALLHREHGGNASTMPVVAGVGFEPTTFRL